VKPTLAAAAVPIVIVLLTWLSFGAVNPNAELFDRALASLDDLTITENTLNRDVLKARAGMLLNYDPLVREMQALDNTLPRLRQNAPEDEATAAAIDRLALSVSRQEDLIEQFKTNNALLRNSLAYFTLLSGNLESSDRTGTLIPAVGPLAAAMLRLTVDASAVNAREVQDRLDELARQPRSPGDAELAQALLAHGQLLHDLLPTTDNILKALSAVPQRRNQDEVRTAILVQQMASRAMARQFRQVLYGASLLLLGLLVYLGFELRVRARALRRRAAFEHVIAGISMRFINAQPQRTGALIEQALAEMAECVGADRAYFLIPGSSNRIHTWSRSGAPFPPGWPIQALALAASSPLTREGIAHIANINALPHGKLRDDLTRFGLVGWACISNTGENGINGLLGFDALRGICRISALGELSLLRMALDTINNAVEREFFEKERTRLQQARRMETVGVLASGIAHNFNNIIGAILGYTEIAESQIEPNSRAGRNLGEIRRSGERARDLVDQILTFGRRRDLRRMRLNVNALVNEAKSLLQASLSSRIELVSNESPEPVIISGEFAQLQQVILNLSTNAAQAIDVSGRVEIETQVEEIDETLSLSHGQLPPGHYARISVRDTGRGMDHATIERIFEPFFTTRPDGHGLGLATVREIVREHGGALDVSSTLGVGSCFEVWLPSATATDLVSNEALSLPLGNGETVLLVNDEREWLLKDEETLAALGYEPVGFTRPDDALAACHTRHERFDVIVIGHVPVAKALDLAAALSRLAPHLPIVLATPSAEDFDTTSLAAAGVSERVHYPLSSAELAEALARCLAIPVSRHHGIDEPMPVHG
jgi:signal transduction histidine kinase